MGDLETSFARHGFGKLGSRQNASLRYAFFWNDGSRRPLSPTELPTLWQAALVKQRLRWLSTDPVAIKYWHCCGSTEHFRGRIAAGPDSATILFGASVMAPAFDLSIEHTVTDIETIPQSLAVKK